MGGRKLGLAAASGTLLRAVARYHHWAGEGVLSVKSFPRGRAVYRAAGGVFAVGPGDYLVLNHGQPYEVEVRGEEPTESLCVFFAPGTIEDVRRSLCTPGQRLLDEPETALPPLVFPERTHPHDGLVSPVLTGLNEEGLSAGEFEERLRVLAERLLRLHFALGSEALRLPSARASTRLELYRRLHRARDYLAALHAEPEAVTLRHTAAVAELSPNHLLRSFKRLFGLTPHQYLTEVRLERAKNLLGGGLSVTQVCLEVGFESLGSFSWLFRRRFGVSPSGYRRAG